MPLGKSPNLTETAQLRRLCGIDGVHTWAARGPGPGTKHVSAQGAFHVQTNQSRAHTPSPSFIWLPWGSHRGPLFPCPNHYRTKHQATGDNSWMQSLLESFQLANPKPAYPAVPVPYHRNHNKGSCPHFPSLPMPPDRPWHFPMRPCLAWPCIVPHNSQLCFWEIVPTNTGPHVFKRWRQPWECAQPRYHLLGPCLHHESEMNFPAYLNTGCLCAWLLCKSNIGPKSVDGLLVSLNKTPGHANHYLTSCFLRPDKSKEVPFTLVEWKCPLPQPHRWAAVHVLSCHLCFYSCLLLLLTMDTREDEKAHVGHLHLYVWRSE